MTEEQALTDIHAILHAVIDRTTLNRIDQICHSFGSSSPAVTQIHTIRHNQQSSASKIRSIHLIVDEYFEPPPPPPEPEYDGTIEGDFKGLIPAGEHWHITGDVNLTGDLIYEGLLTGVDTFTVLGNGFQILGQHGGIAQLSGKLKSGWVRRGQPVSNWQIGDRLCVAPTVEGVYVPIIITWQGSWELTPMPDVSPDKLLADGRIIGPEVGNLDRSIRFENLRRYHLHDGAGPQNLKYLSIVDSGTEGVLGDYPLHFHLNGESSRGSFVVGTVVEGGQNHAYVPHGSHGIFYVDNIAYDTIGTPYWYDLPPPTERKADPPDYSNDPEDLLWQHCLALWVKPTESRSGGFSLGSGLRLGCPDSAAACVQGQPGSASQRAGAVWPERTSRSSWDTRGFVSHNNVNAGSFVWQNARKVVNEVEDTIQFFNGRADIEHGSYQNQYRWRRFVLGPAGFMLHAKSADEGPLVLEDGISEGPLTIVSHNSANMDPTYIRRTQFSTNGLQAKVRYQETFNGSVIHYEDCGYTPTDFDLGTPELGIADSSIIEIKEGGVLTHRWVSGVWG
jgi:hypothetical protein